MEELESEWEIQEYSSSKEGDETNMVKWMLNKGYGIGKKMVITGIAISSVPLVLPPLVVFSAMGVAFSVPFGLVFASYACTNKLMSMLLSPATPSPIMLEYYSYDYEGEKDDGVECRFELDGGGDDYRQIGATEKGYYTCNEYDDEHIGKDNVMQEVEQDQNGDEYAQQVEALATNTDGDVVENGYYTNEYEDDETERKNLMQEEEEIGRENLMQEEEKEQIGEGHVQEVEALVINTDGDVVEKGYYTNEYNGDDTRGENVMQEVEQGQISVGYVQEVESSVTSADKDEVGKGYYTNEYDYDETRRENVKQEVEQEQIGEAYAQECEALVTSADGDVVEKSYYTNEYDDNEIRRENLMQEEKKEQIDEGYVQQVEALVTSTDKDVVEKGYYTDEEEEEGEEDDSRLENVVDDEHTEDAFQGVDIVVEIDDDGDDNRQQGDLVVNVDENVDGRSYYVNENYNERKIEDHVPRMENFIKNEEEQMEDIKQGVEMRLASSVTTDESKQTEEGSVTKFAEGVDDQGYKEDVGEYLEGDDGSLEEEQKRNELLVKSQMDENISNTPEVTDDEKKKEGSDEVMIHNNICEDDRFMEESAANVVLEEVKDVETAEQVMVKEIDSQKLVSDESNNDEPVGEMRHIVVLAGGNEDNNFNSREVEDLDLVAREVLGDANKDEKHIESDEKVVRESMGTQEKVNGDMSNGGTEVGILGTKEEHLSHANADGREIGDESGLDLFDDRNTSIYFESLEAGDEAKINPSHENLDFMALPAFRRVSLDTDNAKLSPITYTKVPLREDIIDDINIWEKIGAMRAIVGYKAPSQPTCIEELKALFVFTGVEPPASFKSDSDLDEVNVKLKFLMSIVGVK